MKNGFPAPNKELQQTKNDHLTGKAPYKFESAFLQRRVICEPEFSRDRSLGLIDGVGHHVQLHHALVDG